MIILNEIVQKAIKGDKESFSFLIKNKKKDIYKIAYSYVNNVEDALDIVQDVIYKSLVSIKDLRKPEYFNTWITRITINCSINHLRKNKKIIYMEEQLINHTHTECKNKEDIMDLKIEINKLEVKYKTVIILKYFKDMSLEEISQILKLPISTVKTRLYRSLKKLKINLEEII